MTETGIIHQNTGSSVRLMDNGNIEMFAQGQAGVLVSTPGNSVNFYGEKANFYNKEIKMNSDKTGLMWNYNVVNSDMTKVQLLEYDEKINMALMKLMQGGIPVTVQTALGPAQGFSNPTSGGMPKWIKPFLYDATSKVVNRATNKIAKGVKR
jgi:hypothetical protein